MARQPEGKIEKAVVDFMKENHNIESIKLNLEGNVGWPDRMFLLPERPAWIEFKMPGQVAAPIQAYRIKTMRAVGYDVITCDEAEVAIMWLLHKMEERA